MQFLSKISLYKPDLRHAVRVTAAALIAYGLNLWLGFEQGYWMVFTAIIVMQGSVGGSLKAAMERMTGTLAGAFYGVFLLVFVPHDTPQSFIVLIILGLVPTAVAASLRPAFRIAPITVAILFFANSVSHTSPLAYAEWRVMEICIGCVIGLVTSLVVLPSRAHKVLAEAVANVLEMEAILLSRLLQAPLGSHDTPVFQAGHGKLRVALAKLDDVANEARRELASYLTTEPDPEPLLRMVRRVRNDLIMIGRAMDQSLPEAHELAAALAAVSAAAGDMLRAVARGLKEDVAIEGAPDIETVFAASAAVIRSLPQDDSETGHVFALKFAIEQLKRDLKDLAARSDDFVRGDKA